MSETTKCNCAKVQVFPQVVENFETSTGINLYDLECRTWEAPVVVYWDTITAETNFVDAWNYFETLAAEWLADGTASHYCD